MKVLYDTVVDVPSYSQRGIGVSCGEVDKVESHVTLGAVCFLRTCLGTRYPLQSWHMQGTSVQLLFILGS